MEGHPLDHLADIMGCKEGSLPTLYLELPSWLGSAYKSLWNLVLVMERVEQKSTSWKAKYLSLWGRITLT